MTEPSKAEASKIVIFGLPFSPNVGDGVIADCLAYEISRQRPNLTVDCIDISGRTGVGAVVVRRGRALRILGALPAPLRRAAVSVVLGRLMRKCKPRWQERVTGARAVLFGGGQIFSDIDLNFPMKLATAASVAKTEGCPTAIVAAGVAHNWTPRGTQIFAALKGTHLRHIALRDAGSIGNWTAQMPQSGLPTPVFCRDPGVLAAQCYGLADRETGAMPDAAPDAPIGIGISDPSELALHADRTTGGGDVLTTVFCDMIVKLAAQGERLQLFCNGADEDAAFMDQIFNDPRLAELRNKGQIAQSPAPRTGAELAAQIAACKAIVAHRLHACIVAYSLCRPFVGLGWDRKLDSFLASVDLPENLADATSGADAVIAQLHKAMARGIDPARQSEARAQCRAQLAALLDDCGITA